MKGHLRFAFDKQSILDLNLKIPDRDDVAAQGTSNSSEVLNKVNSKKHMVDCFVCKRKYEPINMRKHIGHHIINEIVFGINICGFCKQDSCDNNIKTPSSKITKLFFKVESNCPYYVEWRKTPTFSTHNPCSNHLILCSICKAHIWTYNAKHHY